MNVEILDTPRPPEYKGVYVLEIQFMHGDADLYTKEYVKYQLDELDDLAEILIFLVQLEKSGHNAQYELEKNEDWVGIFGERDIWPRDKTQGDGQFLAASDFSEYHLNRGDLLTYYNLEGIPFPVKVTDL